MSSIIDEETWLALLKRDEYQCLYCNSEEDLQPAHYKPRSLGGSEDLNNLMLLCAYCHMRQEHKKLLVLRYKNRFFFTEVK